jgi:hypothetical protein
MDHSDQSYRVHPKGAVMHYLTKVKCVQVLVDFGMSEKSALLSVNKMLDLGYIKSAEEE